MNTTFCRLLLTMGSVMLFSGVAPAQQTAKFPAKPLRLIVPYVPGGATDITARQLQTQPRDGMGSAPYTHYHGDYNSGAHNTIYTGGSRASYLLLPLIRDR
jgi:hypothetical protein